MTEKTETVVIGGGQAGLSVGYHLQRLGRPFVIVEGRERIGDAWRARWDSLRLFTPARFDGLDGMPFPAARHSFPTKDEMADYLEAYAARFDLPVRTGSRVERVQRHGDGFLVSGGDLRIEADNVVVAMANFQQPRVPSFAGELDPSIRQLHSSAYRSTDQLADGALLVVGAGNSGAEIALETARTHTTFLSGRHPGHLPFRIESRTAKVLVPVVFRVVFHRVLTLDTPIGRRIRPKATTQGAPLIRVKPVDLDAAGVRRVPRVAGVRDGRPELADGRVVDVANVIWCTGFDPGFTWLDFPDCAPGEPKHERGVMPSVPGLYFVGLNFLYALSSLMIHGVGRDACRIAEIIAAGRRAGAQGPGPGRAAHASSRA